MVSEMRLEPGTTERTKHCSKCLQILPWNSFSKKVGRGCGRHSRCNTCRVGDNKAARAADPARAAAYEHVHRIKSRYGLSPAQLTDMMEKQGGGCAICKTTLGTGMNRHIDHNHSTLAVRGLLCRGCNIGLGNFAEDPARLTAAIHYLHTHANNN